jgi:tRNA (guanine37-N1)-methyltransferase
MNEDPQADTATSPARHARVLTEDADMSSFLPPIVRSAGPLNRAVFTKTLQLAAARVNNVRDIARYRKALTASKELLLADRISAVVEDPAPPAPAPEQGAAAAAGRKCLLLRHGISAAGR